MLIKDNSTPVVILKSFHHGALGITRSLGRLGVPVYGIDRDARSPMFSSRYCRGKFIWDIERAPAAQSVEFLKGVAAALGGRPILVPTSDPAALFVAAHAADLNSCFLFPNQPPELVHSLCSKESMYYLAKRNGIPTAETVFPRSHSDVLSFLETAQFPLILKLIDGTRTNHTFKTGKYIVANPQEVLDIYDRVDNLSNPNIMIQEYIPGGEDTIWMFNGYFDEQSDCVVGFTGKKIRQCPVYTGVTSLGVCLSNEIVDQTTRSFMKAIGYQGVLDIGYRYDARDGKYKVLDVNPRIGATFRLFVSEDEMDVARAMYLQLTGQPVRVGTAPEGRKWLVEDFDLVSCFRYCSHGKLRLRDWIASYRGVKETAFFQRSDPLPALMRLRIDFNELGRRLRSRLERATAPETSAERKPGEVLAR